MSTKEENKKKFGWSKYGGGNHATARMNIASDVKVWYCQCCRAEIPRAMTPYLIEIFEREYARICWSCYHIARIENILDFLILKTLIRPD